MKRYHIIFFLITATAFLLVLTGCSMPVRKVQYPPPSPQAPEVIKPAEEAVSSSPQEDKQPGVSEEPSVSPTSEALPSPESGQAQEAHFQDLRRDIAYVEQRLAAYEKKFQQWLELQKNKGGAEQDSSTPMAWDDCMARFEDLLTGYTRLRDRMLDGLSSQNGLKQEIDTRQIFSQDVSFLESDCEKLLIFGSSAAATKQYGGADRATAIRQAEALIDQYFQEEEYEEVISLYQLLPETFPEREASLTTDMQYGLALIHTGQIEVATYVFQDIHDMLSAVRQIMEPWTMQRQMADLLLATGNFTKAKSQYENLINSYDSFNDQNAWAMIQLGILDEFRASDGKLADYRDLLQDYLIFNSKEHSPLELLDKADEIARNNSNTVLADGALQIKLAIEKQLTARTYKYLNLADELVKKKNFKQATTMLNELSPNNLPSELRDIIQEKLDEVLLTETQELETQRVLSEQSLADRWETANNLLDSERYDAAIADFESLIDTDYDERARKKIAEAANLAATAKRKDAAALFIKAVKTEDTDQKKELLLNSRRLLQEILTRYPEVNLIDKVTQNLETIEEHIRQFDPSLLEDTDEDQMEEREANPEINTGEKVGGGMSGFNF